LSNGEKIPKPNNHFNDQLSQEQLNKLKEYNDTLSPYAYLKDGDVVEWHFDPSYIEKVHDDRYDNDRIEFKCYDPKLDHEFKWPASMGAARQVVALLKKGVYFMHIERHGADIKTRYTVQEVA
jgi:Asp-tRNA(Asn)/Glu-tRNA(Gln) amidotransferase B subunit